MSSSRQYDLYIFQMQVQFPHHRENPSRNFEFVDLFRRILTISPNIDVAEVMSVLEKSDLLLEQTRMMDLTETGHIRIDCFPYRDERVLHRNEIRARVDVDGYVVGPEQPLNNNNLTNDICNNNINTDSNNTSASVSGDSRSDIINNNNNNDSNNNSTTVAKASTTTAVATSTDMENPTTPVAK